MGNGGRDYDDLKKFADSLKPLCSPSQRDLCDEEQLAQIDKYADMGKDALEALIADGEKAIEDAETTFKEEVETWQKRTKRLLMSRRPAWAWPRVCWLAFNSSRNISCRRGGDLAKKKKKRNEKNTPNNTRRTSLFINIRATTL